MILRRNTYEQIKKLEEERDRLEAELANMIPYQKLKAQGMFGAETTFADYKALTARLDRVKEQLTVLHNGR